MVKIKTMLPIEQLSFWERKEYFEEIDFLIIGAGIVGCSTALHLRKKYPSAKIIVLERGILPCGASTKNAGFACFGGPVELLDDLKKNEPKTVWQTVEERYKGLVYMRELLGDQYLDLKEYGGWDLIGKEQTGLAQHVRDKLPMLNEELRHITGVKNVFSEDKKSVDTFGFAGIQTAFSIQLEAQIDTAKMMKRYHQLLSQAEISIFFAMEVLDIDSQQGIVLTPIGGLQARHIFLTVNGFASQFLPQEEVLPARAQVLVTSPLKKLPFKGNFHHDSGFYYFRNVQNRILLGGGRNLDIEGETTYDMSTSILIQNKLEKMLSEVILPQHSYSIDYRWSGIMGVGTSKYPIVKKITDKLSLGVRLGGIGVAIGTSVGKKLADLL